MRQHQSLVQSLTLVLLLFLASIASAEIIEPSPDTTPIEQARYYEKTHNYQQAADMYLITARKMPTPESGEPWRVKAAEMAWMASNPQQAETIVQGTDESRLNPTMKARLRLMAARIARRNGDYQGVLKQLEFPADKLPRSIRKQIEALANEANRRLIATGQISPKTPEPAEMTATFEYWNELRTLSPQQLQNRLGRARADTEKGWLELALIDKAYSGARQRNAFQRWQRRYPDHPASAYVAPKIEKRLFANASTDPHQIAILLPRLGRYGALSQVILEGIEAAQSRLPAGSPLLTRVYDSSQGDITALYQQAAAEGAELALGPMDKQKVDTLTRQAADIPAITLNYGNDVNLFNPGLYQFALLPEDEAHAAASKIAERGYSRVAILAPDSHWGQRVSEAFRQQAGAVGLEVIAQGAFNPRNHDLSSVIQKTFKVADNRAEIEPDAIFIVATPRQGRLLKPLLKYHFLGHLPVFSTSHIFSGAEDPSADGDLNGIEFPEIPWLLKRNTEEAAREKLPGFEELSAIAQQHPRLFAFGYDALNLSLKLLNSPASQLQLQGLSGNLYLDRRNRVHRLLGWARFEHGKPVAESLPGNP
ncbi:MAG TPA: penicillin-binding protein activator [Gammaproteobacteria bacterium]|nr:penicillin-binding protein activator [Gammaproteobacteria bacterium]